MSSGTRGRRVRSSLGRSVRWRAARGTPGRTRVGQRGGRRLLLLLLQSAADPRLPEVGKPAPLGFTQCKVGVRIRAAALDLNRDPVAECATARRLGLPRTRKRRVRCSGRLSQAGPRSDRAIVIHLTTGSALSTLNLFVSRSQEPRELPVDDAYVDSAYRMQ
ncbi:hypothetical protein MTO96_013323 [Rhipicephalus appendiculatus]